MQQKAVVRSVNDDGTAIVAVVRRSACSGDCDSCHGCGAFTQEHVVTARNSVGAQAGERVIIESDTQKILKATVIVFLLPTVMLILGAAIWVSIGRTALGLALGGGCFALGFIPAFLYERKLKKTVPVEFRITALLNNNG